MRASAWVPRGLLGFVVLVMASRVVVSWSELPERFASHFGPSGMPDGFVPRGTFFAVIAFVGGGTVALLTLLPLLLRFVPTELMNLPNRDYWLAPERREASLGRIATSMTWMAFATTVLLALVIDQTIRANLAHAGLDMGVVSMGVALYGVSAVAVVVWLFLQFRMPERA